MDELLAIDLDESVLCKRLLDKARVPDMSAKHERYYVELLMRFSVELIAAVFELPNFGPLCLREILRRQTLNRESGAASAATRARRTVAPSP